MTEPHRRERAPIALAFGLRSVVVAGAILLGLAGCGKEAAVNAGSGSSPSGDGVTSGVAKTGTPVPSGTGVQGIVTNGSGPVQLASITVSGGSRQEGPVTQEANVTDAEGRYFLPLPPGRWEVKVNARRFEDATFSVEVTEGKPVVHDVVLKLAK